MATAKQIAWRKKFAARYGGKKRKAKARKAKRSPKRSVTMARRRRSPVRRRVSRAYGRFRRSRTNTIPAIDIIHGIYTADGITGGNSTKAISTVTGLLTGKTNPDTVYTQLQADVDGAVTYVTKTPQKAIMGGVQKFATVWLVRKALGWIGVPKSVKLFKNTRLQVR